MTEAKGDPFSVASVTDNICLVLAENNVIGVCFKLASLYGILRASQRTNLTVCMDPFSVCSLNIVNRDLQGLFLHFSANSVRIGFAFVSSLIVLTA